MPPHPPNETDPLIPAPATTPTPGKRDGRIPVKLCLLILVMVIAASFGLFSLMFPITQCNDPADPLVRDRIRKEWSLELDQHEREKRRQESERDRWTNDEAVREQTRREWQHETERHNHQMEERRKQEEDDRQRLGISWSDLTSRDQCLTHGSKEYTAQLLNVPAGYNLLKACMGTSVVIRDVVFERPIRCHVDHQEVTHGFWVVHNEPSCSTYWENFKDKGCTAPGSGSRRIEAHLGGLYWKGDWKEMCSTTPADFDGTRFNGPHSCDNWGQYGIWGIWWINDASC